MKCSHFGRWSRGAIGAAFATIAVGGPVAHAEAPVGDFRVKLEQWVETRQILSQEKADWEADRELLQATRDLLGRQRQSLKEEIAALEETITEADQERVDLLLARGEYKRTTAAMEALLPELEAEVTALVPRLPAPLVKKLEPLLVQIPENPAEARTSLGQRLVNVLGVLLQAEKWNGTATLTGETRAVRPDSDQKVQVRTLYWGLGQAIYVDSRGEVAGIGRPGPDGWRFEDDPDLADDASLLIDIFEGNTDVIRFVNVPVALDAGSTAGE